MTAQRVSAEQAARQVALLDFARERFNLRTDAALARLLRVAPTVISKYRHGAMGIGATVRLYMIEFDIMKLYEINAFLAEPEETVSEKVVG